MVPLNDAVCYRSDACDEEGTARIRHLEDYTENIHLPGAADDGRDDLLSRLAKSVWTSGLNYKREFELGDGVREIHMGFRGGGILGSQIDRGVVVRVA